MQLAVNTRTETGKKIVKLRKAGIVPAIVYGKHIDTPVLISFDKQEFIKLYKKAGFSTPITLKGDGVDQLVLIHELQLDPVSDQLLHADFLALKKGEKVATEVTIILEGLAPIEKLGEGRVQLVKDSVEVKALPKDLPHDIKIDVSKLETTHDVIFVKDLEVGKGVEVLADPELPIVTIVALAADDEVEEEAGEENAAGTAGEDADATTETEEKSE